MGPTSIRVLVVDDFEPWRVFVCSALQKRLEFQIIGQASDGLEAVLKAQELQPDLIILDVGLPGIDGIEAGGRIRHNTPKAKILFVSENHSPEIVEKALRTGARGYVIKSEAGRDLLPAVEAVFLGKRFVPSSLANQLSTFVDEPATTEPRIAETDHHHAVQFYSNERSLLDTVTRFIAVPLNAQGAAIVIATAEHRRELLLSLRAQGIDVVAAVAQGRYVELDAASVLSALMVDGMLDIKRFAQTFDDVIMAAKAVAQKGSRVAVFGEAGRLLLEQGNVQAAIQDEKLWNKLVKTYDLDVLCGYSLDMKDSVSVEDPIFQQICAEHFSVYLPSVPVV